MSLPLFPHKPHCIGSQLRGPKRLDLNHRSTAGYVKEVGMGGEMNADSQSRLSTWGRHVVSKRDGYVVIICVTSFSCSSSPVDQNASRYVHHFHCSHFPVSGQQKPSRCNRGRPRASLVSTGDIYRKGTAKGEAGYNFGVGHLRQSRLTIQLRIRHLCREISVSVFTLHCITFPCVGILTFALEKHSIKRPERVSLEARERSDTCPKSSFIALRKSWPKPCFVNTLEYRRAGRTHWDGDQIDDTICETLADTLVAHSLNVSYSFFPVYDRPRQETMQHLGCSSETKMGLRVGRGGGGGCKCASTVRKLPNFQVSKHEIVSFSRRDRRNSLVQTRIDHKAKYWWW